MTLLVSSCMPFLLQGHMVSSNAFPCEHASQTHLSAVAILHAVLEPSFNTLIAPNTIGDFRPPSLAYCFTRFADLDCLPEQLLTGTQG